MRPPSGDRPGPGPPEVESGRASSDPGPSRADGPTGETSAAPEGTGLSPEGTAHSEGSWGRGWGRGLKWSFQLGLTVVVTWVIVRQVGVTLEEALALDAALPAVRPGFVLLSALLLLLGFAVAARLWGRMVGELGGPDPGWIASNRIVLPANLGRYLPGKVMQVAGLAVLARREGIPVTLAVTAGVLGQLFHLVGAAVVGVAALGTLDGIGWGIQVGLGALAVFVLASGYSPLLRSSLRLLFRLARLDPADAPSPGPLFGPRWVVLHTLLWCGYGAAFALLVHGLGLESDIVLLATAFSAAYLLGYLAIFAPAGLGVREGILIALLRPSVGAAAVGVAVLARVWMTVVELLPAGLLALWVIFRRAPATTNSGGTTDG